MAKKNTNKKAIKSNVDEIKYLDQDFKSSIKKSKGLSKGEYLEKTLNLKLDQFNHKKSMDWANFGLKSENAKENRKLSKYKVDQKIALDREKYNKELAFREKKFKTQMSMNIQNEAAKLVEAKKRAKKDALKSVWHGFFGHRF